MSRSFWIYVGLLAALLVLAWFRWTGVIGADEEDKAETVVILRAEQQDLEHISFHNEKLDVSIHLKEDGFGSYAWVELEERKKKPKPKIQPEEDLEAPDGAADGAEADAEVEADVAADEPAEDAVADGEEAAADGEEAEEEEEEFEIEISNSQFKGGEAVSKVLEALAPLEAVRSLGEVAPDKLEELELAEPESWLEVTRKGKVRRIEVGGEAYGTRDFYVRDTETGKFYLVDADVFRPLKYAKSRLPDRRLSELEREDIVRVVLESDSGSVEMVQQNRDDKDAAYWANPQELERSIELYDNWLDKALRLKGLSYVQEEDKPGDLEPAFAVTLQPEEGPATIVRVFEAPDEEGGESEWYASSEFTRGLLKLHKVLASEAAQDVPDVIEARADEDDEDDEDEEVLELLAP